MSVKILWLTWVVMCMSCSRVEVPEEKNVELQEPANFSEFVQSGKLSNKIIKKIKTNRVKIKDIKIKNFKLENVNLFASDFENIVFSDGEYESVKMDGSIFKNVKFINVRFTKTNFSSWYNDRDSFLENVIFDNCVFDDVEIDELKESQMTFINSNANNLSISGEKIKLVVENTNFTDSYFDAKFDGDLEIQGGDTVQLSLGGSTMKNIIIEKVTNIRVDFFGNVESTNFSAVTGSVTLSGNIPLNTIVFKKKGHVTLGSELKKVNIYYPKGSAGNVLFLMNSDISKIKVYNLNTKELCMINSKIDSLEIERGNIARILCMEKTTIGTLKMHNVNISDSVEIDDLNVDTLHVINGSGKPNSRDNSARRAVVKKFIREKPGQPVDTREKVEGMHILDLL